MPRKKKAPSSPPRKPAAKKRTSTKPADVAADVVVEPKAVTEFVWRGKTRFRCSKCPFDSGSEAETYQHYLSRHVEPPPKPTHVDTGLLSADGGKIVRVEEVQNGED